MLNTILPDMVEGEEGNNPSGIEELRIAYNNLKRRQDRISKHILNNIDP
jgi:hypothetical protein